MNIIEVLNTIKVKVDKENGIKKGEIVSICSYEHAIENNPNNLYVSRSMTWDRQNVKVTKITVEARLEGYTWYNLDGINFAYQEEWLIRR